MKKFLRRTFLYLCVTVLTAVSVVFITKPDKDYRPDASAAQPTTETTAFDSLVSNIMTAQGIELNIDADLTSKNTSDMRILGEVYLDMSNGFDKIAVEGSLTIVDKLDIDFAYLDGWVYLSALGGQYKINTAKIEDLFGIITDIAKDALPSTMSVDNALFSNINVTDLMTSLQNIDDEEIENGHKLTCNLLGIDIEIITDEEYKIDTINTSTITYSDYSITPHVDMNIPEMTRDIEVIETDYIDLSNVDILLRAVSNLISNEKVYVQADLTYSDTTYTAMVKVDWSEGLRAQLETSIKDTNIVITIIDNVIYLDVKDLGLGVRINSIDSLVILLNELGLDITPYVGILEKIENIDMSSVNMSDISLSMLNKFEISANECTLDIAGIGNIKVILSDEKLNMISFKNSEVETNLNVLAEDFAIITPTTDVINLDNILEFIPTIKQYISNTNFVGHAKLNYKGQLLDIDYHVSYIEQELRAELTTKFYNFDINIIYMNGIIYASIDGVKLSLPVDEINSLITWIENTFKTKIDLDTFDMSDIVVSSLGITDKTINIGLNIADINVTIDGSVLLDINTDDFSLSLDLFQTNDLITVNANEYNDYTTITTMIDSVIKSVTSKQLSVGAKATAYSGDTVRLNADCDLMLDYSSNILMYAEVLLSGEQDFEFNLACNDEMWYLNYNKLKVKVSKNSISDIITTIAGMLNIDLSQAKYFENLTKLNGINIDTINSLLPGTKINNYLDLLSLVKDITLDENSLTITISSSTFTGVENEYDTTITLNMLNGELNSLYINNLYTGKANEHVDISLDFDTFTGVKQIEDKDNYIDLSDSVGLIKALANTSKLTDFKLSATLNINMNLASIKDAIKMNLPVDIRIKLVDNKPQIMAEIGPIPVIAPIDNDVPYKIGDTVSGAYCGLNRVLRVYYADGYVYFYRSETVPVVGKDRTYEKMLKITLDEFMSDPMMILSYGCGFKDLIMDEIDKAMALATNRETPIDLSNVLLGFEKVDNSYNLTLNLREIANNPQLDKIQITLSTSVIDGIDYITNGSLDVAMPISSAFSMDLSSKDLSLDIGATLDWSSFDAFVSSYPYKVDEKYHASNGKWELLSATTYTVMFVENGGEDVSDITGAIDTEYVLPNLQTRETDDGNTHITYTFDGWYTTSDFKGDRYTNNKIVRGDITLYAKWNEKIEYYRDVVIVNELLDKVDYIHALQGSEMNISLSFDDVIIALDTSTTTYHFAGWYADADYSTEWTSGNIVPDYNVTLYAKWDIVSVVETKLVNIYDNGVLISSTGHVVGERLILPEGINVTAETKWYLDADYTTEYTIPEIMPNTALDIHIRNKYTITIVDEACGNATVTLTGYQGEGVTLPNNYATKVVDDGTKTKQDTYTFVGFSENLTAFKNSNATIIVAWDVETKYYYNVTFSKDNNVASAYKSYISFPVESLRVLEGTEINLSQYKPVWQYNTSKHIYWHYKFEGWSTKKGGTNISSIVVTEDTTIYANWDGVVKTGKA